MILLLIFFSSSELSETKPNKFQYIPSAVMLPFPIFLPILSANDLLILSARTSLDVFLLVPMTNVIFDGQCKCYSSAVRKFGVAPDNSHILATHLIC